MTLREDVAVGWEALDQWGDDVARIERCQTGVANEVWSVRVNRHLAVGRLGKRSDTRPLVGDRAVATPRP